MLFGRLAAIILCTLASQISAAIAAPLHEAAITGDLKSVEALLDGGADVNAPDPSGPPLVWALFGGNEPVAQLLLDRGADPNSEGMGGTVLFHACIANMSDVVAALLQNGADPNQGGDSTPLIAAAGGGDEEIVTALLNHGAKPNASDAEGITPLHEAARFGHIDVVRVLLAGGAEANALTVSGRPPIHYAKLHGHEAVAAHLAKNGAKPGTVAKISGVLASADVVEGAKEAEVCFNCHSDVRGVSGYNAPTLWDIVGRPRGAIGAFKYSPVMSDIGGEWTIEALNQYIARPTEIIPGTNMDFIGIPDPMRRAHLIAYLRTLSDSPVPIAE